MIEDLKPQLSTQKLDSEICPPGSNKVECEIYNGRKKLLSEKEEVKARKSIEEGNPEELIEILRENGIPASSQVELAAHYTKDLQESIRLIAWTKKRLTYTTAILEHTLNSDNKKVTSAENLIQNYLIFNRIFQEKENKLPRFGQFVYVMRSIFNGIETREEIYNRIESHKTFGEGLRLDRNEIDNLSKEIKKIDEEIKQQFAASQEKKRLLDQTIKEAMGDENQQKGTTWNVSYSEPREYTLPNYIFQTGPRKGMNQAPGRSSWEPMFLAYADVVNKRMADRISAEPNVSEEEKNKRITKQRIELLYEPYNFPVDIKKRDNGSERPVIYIPDFVDINRWRVIEIKGPLTPKAAEKIRLFKKYYVDGDFSDLPEDKKIIMMSYVQNKKDEITEWCKEREYPVFDHFSSIDVLGAYKWDPELNNFNRYAGAKDMPGLSDRAKAQLQKGFFKLIEDRIDSGKTPDIRPESYAKTGQLPDLIRINEITAKAKKIPYELKNPSSTSPYIPRLIADTIVTARKKQMDEKSDYALSLVARSILNTLPIAPERKEQFVNISKISHILNSISSILENSIKNPLRENFRRLENGSLIYPVPIPEYYNFESFLNGLENFRDYLLKIKPEKKEKTNRNEFNFDQASEFIKLFIDLHRKRYDKSQKIFFIDKDFAEKTLKLSLNDKLMNLLSFYDNYLLGEHQQLYYRRVYEINNLASIDNSVSEEEKNKLLANFRKLKKMGHEGNKEMLKVILCKLNADKLLAEKKDLHPALFIISKSSREVGLAPSNVWQLFHFVQNKFDSIEKAAHYFSEQSGDQHSRADYLKTLDYLNSNIYSSRDINNKGGILNLDEKDKKILISISEIILRDTFSEEEYQKLILQFETNLKKDLMY